MSVKESLLEHQLGTSSGNGSDQVSHAIPVVYPRQVLLLGALGLLASVADPILTNGVIFNILDFAAVGDSPEETLAWRSFLSLVLAICIYLFAVGTAIAFGQSMADLHDRTDNRRWRQWIAWLTGATWLGMGIGLAAMRMFEDKLLDPTSTEPPNLVMAGILLVLHIGSGLCLITSSYTHYNSSWYHVHGAMRKAEKATRDAAERIAEYEHAVAALAKNRRQVHLVIKDREAHLTLLRNAEARLKDQVRARLAAYLGDPSQSSLMDEPHTGTKAVEAVTLSHPAELRVEGE